jgi:adenosyl cobinamide kinase/adenosyl cobinamide phosphate guanylyltransferase
MVMITGGAYQGKTAYVTREFGIAPEDITDGRSCDIASLSTARCISSYHELVRRLGADCTCFTEELCRRSPDTVIIIDEIGCGIVPMEKSERLWRENVGRCGCIIASHSKKVIRVVCGIPAFIKGERE